jgi:hypothetical protein
VSADKSKEAAKDSGGSPYDKPSKTATKADLRREARKKREAEWEAFLATKPDNSYENPEDVEAIREAQENMGDYKLKSDLNYVPPEVCYCQAIMMVASKFLDLGWSLELGWSL